MVNRSELRKCDACDGDGAIVTHDNEPVDCTVCGATGYLDIIDLLVQAILLECETLGINTTEWPEWVASLAERAAWRIADLHAKPTS